MAKVFKILTDRGEYNHDHGSWSTHYSQKDAVDFIRHSLKGDAQLFRVKYRKNKETWVKIEKEKW